MQIDHCVHIIPSLFTAEKGCPLPMSPEHGRLSCKTPGSGEASDISSSDDLLDEGSVCRYDCDPGYAVPPSQIHLAVIRCRAHSWNSTADPSCEGELFAQVFQQQKLFCILSSLWPAYKPHSQLQYFTTMPNSKIIVNLDWQWAEQYGFESRATYMSTLPFPNLP